MIPLVIGRDGSCDVVVGDSSVSRKHLKLAVDEEGTYRLTDLGSTNGTYVFKDREPVGVIEALVTLSDRVKIGKLDFTVRELVSMSRGRRACAQDTATVNLIDALASQEYLQLQGRMGNNVCRFFASDWKPIWDFLEEYCQETVVRQQAHGLFDGKAWKIILIFESDVAHDEFLTWLKNAKAPLWWW